MRSPIFALALLVVFPGAAFAQADTSPSDAAPRAPGSTFERAHVGVEGLLGLGTPLGSVGLSLFASPHPMVSIDAGLGLAISGELQKSVMVRLQPAPGRRVGVSLGLGLSSGEFTWRHEGWDLYARKHWDQARWANLELSTAIARGHSQVRWFVGFSRQLTPDTGCEDQVLYDDNGFPVREAPAMCSDDDGATLVYTGAAFRFATPFSR